MMEDELLDNPVCMHTSRSRTVQHRHPLHCIPSHCVIVLCSSHRTSIRTHASTLALLLIFSHSHTISKSYNNSEAIAQSSIMPDRGKQPARSPPPPRTPNGFRQREDQPAQQDEQAPQAGPSGQTNGSQEDPQPSTEHGTDTTLDERPPNDHGQSFYTPLSSPINHQLFQTPPHFPQRPQLVSNSQPMPSVIRQNARHVFANLGAALARRSTSIRELVRLRRKRLAESEAGANPLGTHHPLNTQIDGRVPEVVSRVDSLSNSGPPDDLSRTRSLSSIESSLNPPRSNFPILEPQVQLNANGNNPSPAIVAPVPRSASFATLSVFQRNGQHPVGLQTIRESNDLPPTPPSTGFDTGVNITMNHRGSPRVIEVPTRSNVGARLATLAAYRAGRSDHLDAASDSSGTVSNMDSECGVDADNEASRATTRLPTAMHCPDSLCPGCPHRWLPSNAPLAHLGTHNSEDHEANHLEEGDQSIAASRAGPSSGGRIPGVGRNWMPQPQHEREAALASRRVTQNAQARPQRRVEDIQEGEPGPSSNLAPLADPRLFELTEDDLDALDTAIIEAASDANQELANRVERFLSPRSQPQRAMEQEEHDDDDPIQRLERLLSPRSQRRRFEPNPSPTSQPQRAVEQGERNRDDDQRFERSPSPRSLLLRAVEQEELDDGNQRSERSPSPRSQPQRFERSPSPRSLPQRAVEQGEHNDDDPTHWRFLEGSSRNQSWTEFWPGELRRSENVSYDRYLQDPDLQRELHEAIDRAPGPGQTRPDTINESDVESEHEASGLLPGPTPRPTVRLPQSPYRGNDTSGAQDSRAATPLLNAPGESADSESESEVVAREARRGPMPRTLLTPSPMPRLLAVPPQPLPASQAPIIPPPLGAGDVPVRPRAPTPLPSTSPAPSTASEDSDGLVMAPARRRRSRSRERLSLLAAAARGRTQIRTQAVEHDLREPAFSASPNIDKSDVAISPAPTNLSTAETLTPSQYNIIAELAARANPNWFRRNEAMHREVLLLLRRYSYLGERDAEIAINQWEHEIMQRDLSTPVDPVDYLRHPFRRVAVAWLSKMLFNTLRRVHQSRAARELFPLQPREYDVPTGFPEVADPSLYRPRQHADVVARPRSRSDPDVIASGRMPSPARRAYQDRFHEEMMHVFNDAVRDRSHLQSLDTVRSWHYRGWNNGNAQLDARPGEHRWELLRQSSFRRRFALRPLYGAGEWFRRRDQIRFERSRDRILLKRAPDEAAQADSPPIPTSLLWSNVGERLVQEMRERYEREMPMPIQGLEYSFRFFEILHAVAWVHRNILMQHNRPGLVPDRLEFQRAIARRIYAWQRSQRAEFERTIHMPGYPLMVPGPRDVIELVQMRQEEFYRHVPLDAPSFSTRRLTTRASCPARLEENADCQCRRSCVLGLTRIEYGALERPVPPLPRRSNTWLVPASPPELPPGRPAPLPASVSQFLDRVEASQRPLVIGPEHYQTTGGYVGQQVRTFDQPQGTQQSTDGFLDYVFRPPGEPQALQQDEDPDDDFEDEGYEELAAASTPFEVRAARRQRRANDRVVACPARPRVVLPPTSRNPAHLPLQLEAAEAAEPLEGRQPTDGYFGQQFRAFEEDHPVQYNEAQELYEEIAEATTMDPESRFAYLRRLAAERRPAIVLAAARSLDLGGQRGFLQRLTRERADAALRSTSNIPAQPQTMQQDQDADAELRRLGDAEMRAISELDPQARRQYIRTLVTAPPENYMAHTPLLTVEELRWVRAVRAQHLMVGTSHNQAAWPPQPGAAGAAEPLEGRRDTVGGVEPGPAQHVNGDGPKTNGHAHRDEELDVEDDVPRAPTPP